MTVQSKTTLKSYFETNDTPTQANFADLIDTAVVGTSVDATAYGATGDGSTNDTTALQNAINAAENGVLNLPFGTYVVASALVVDAPITILGVPGTKILLDSGDSGLTNLLNVGDGTTAFAGVTIRDIIFDGNDAVIGNAPTAGGTTGLFKIVGPVDRVNVERCGFMNGRGLGVNVKGATADRCEFINFRDCWIDDVGEGVKIEDCNHLVWDGGFITNMTSQDGWEPHGNCSHITLKNCYLKGSGPGNCAIEIFPQIGSMDHINIENCHIVDNELRISLGSGAGGSDPSVTNTTVKDCHFQNSIAYCGVGGKVGNTTFAYNHFEGNSNFIDSAAKPHAGIFVSLAVSPDAAMNNYYIGNRISNYDGWGIIDGFENSIFIANAISDCNQNRDSLSGLRGGIKCTNKAVLVGNSSRNVNGNTQSFGIEVQAGTTAQVIGNLLDGNGTKDLGGDATIIKYGNINGKDKIIARVTVSAGQSIATIDQAATGLDLASQENVVIYPITFGNTSVDPMAPATSAWLYRGGSTLQLRLNAALNNNCTFLIIEDNTVPPQSNP